jgi:maleylpyruvate isomerase
VPTDGGPARAGGSPAGGPAAGGSPAGGPAGGLPDGVDARVKLVDEATGELLSALAGPGWAGLDPGRATLCPGWTAGHVLTHLARNADGLRRGAEGARRGEAVPMYDSAQARDRDIEAGAGRPLAELVADVTGSARALAAVWAAMGEADWAREMPHHRVGPIPLTATPAMRLGEVLIHHVDLAGPYGPGDWPAVFVASLLSDAGDELAARLPDGISAQVRATDTGAVWSAGSGTPVAVSGPSWAVAAWLIGRPAAARPALSIDGGGGAGGGAGAALPELKAWG